MELITLKKAASLLGVSLSTARRWFDAGRISGIVSPTGQRRPSKESVDKLLQETNQPLAGITFED